MSHAPRGSTRFNVRKPSPVNPAVVGIAITPPWLLMKEGQMKERLRG
jgi:hypothetical protein